MIQNVGQTRAATAEPSPQQRQLREAAEAFEAVFLRQMIGSMRQAKLAEDDLFGSSASDQFRDMADARTADTLASRGAFGVADLLMQQFGRQVAAPSAATSTATDGTPE